GHGSNLPLAAIAFPYNDLRSLKPDIWNPSVVPFGHYHKLHPYRAESRAQSEPALAGVEELETREVKLLPRFNSLRKRWLPSFSSPPLGEITEGKASCEIPFQQPVKIMASFL